MTASTKMPVSDKLKWTIRNTLILKKKQEVGNKGRQNRGGNHKTNNKIQPYQ